MEIGKNRVKISRFLRTLCALLQFVLQCTFVHVVYAEMMRRGRLRKISSTVDMEDFAGRGSFVNPFQKQTIDQFFREHGNSRNFSLLKVDYHPCPQEKSCFSGETVLLEKREEFFGRSHDPGMFGQHLVAGVQHHVERQGDSVKTFDLKGLIGLIIVSSIGIKLDEDEIFSEGFQHLGISKDILFPSIGN